ncbi:MAG TPA: deoxyribodipyrimidine photo-lyase, partial [Nocardioides sp.]|nr:deoxyribodipyrimidine photo-lyase [Nocardioides sp.]
MSDSVLWLRRDLRRRDLPALGEAAEAAGNGDGDVHVLFVIDPALWDGCGPVRRGWLSASIRAAADAYDGRLTVRVGDPATKVGAFAAEVGAGSVHVSAETTPYGARRDDRVRQRLAEKDVEWVATGSPYAVGPGRVTTKGDKPYRVFTPFAR